MTSSALDLISAERRRQIAEEGWPAAHDDQHVLGQLRLAAVCYLGERDAASRMPDSWPWQLRYWKPSDDQVRNLVKAGALIVAEIERLQRANERSTDA
jgi:hypothetical protein